MLQMTNQEFTNLHQPEYLTAILIATKQYREECKMITLTQEEKQALTKDLMKKVEKRQIYDTELQGKGNSIKRNAVSRVLKTYGFEEGGCYSTSAVFRFEENTKGWKLSWGQRYNFGGKNIKYFTLYKYFKNKIDVVDFLTFFNNHHLS